MGINLENEEIKRIAALDYGWQKLKNKTVLLSGGTGFIGQYFINVIKYRNEKFGDNIRVFSLSRHARQNEANVTYLQADVTKCVDVNGRIDFILHLASNTHPKQYSEDPVGTVTTNIFGCYNLLELARKTGAKRFLLASSVEVYGEGTQKPMDESFCGPIDCNSSRAGYNEAKRLCESLCQSYRAQYGIDCVIARFARCFGYDTKNDTKAVAQFLKKAVDGEDIILKSEGKQRFSYCYVGDAVSAIFKILLDGADGEAYNISDDDENKTLGDYANLIASFAGKKVTFDFDKSKNLGVSKANFALLDCAKLKALGWQPLWTVSGALQETYKKYLQNK